jgi:hypothetical protein
VVEIPRDKGTPAAIHGLNFYKSKELAREQYYRMYTADLPGGKVCLSSTFKDLGIPGLINVKEAPFGELFSVAT